LFPMWLSRHSTGDTKVRVVAWRSRSARRSG